MDPSINNLLKWSIENTAPSTDNPSAVAGEGHTTRAIDPEALRRLLSNAPSDAELMKAAIQVARDPQDSLENRLIAFDNFEQLVENLDNANNMEPLGLWTPLVDTLNDPVPDIRKMAAWCIGTAVQNNEKSQERLLVFKGIPQLLRMAREDPDLTVRRKSIYAISSAVRNYQPALDELKRHLPADIVGADEKLDAGDMDRINEIIARLRE
ncbi:hsp70 nucleotide exchange factor fes1 [Myotisia sp. PD_48]|nr:hsp70 nucleotide exchange factor fes1 [Myotisia sp. PD_48]